jgi:glutamine synthetase
MYSDKPQTKRVEFRCPDSSCNPYLAFSSMLMAAIDGIENKIHPGDPMDKDIYHLTSEEYEKIGSAPGALDEALLELENDHEFLLNGDVFTADVIHYWIKYKRENEVDAIRMRPHPYEFCMYFDI